MSIEALTTTDTCIIRFLTKGTVYYSNIRENGFRGGGVISAKILKSYGIKVKEGVEFSMKTTTIWDLAQIEPTGKDYRPIW